MRRKGGKKKGAAFFGLVWPYPRFSHWRFCSYGGGEKATFSEDGGRWRRRGGEAKKKVISQLRCSFAGLGSERGLEPSAAAGDAEKELELKLGQIKIWRGKKKKGHLKKKKTEGFDLPKTFSSNDFDILLWGKNIRADSHSEIPLTAVHGADASNRKLACLSSS